MEKNFTATKQSIDGLRKQWGQVSNLTHTEARDEVRFPLGKQIDADRTTFVWTYYHTPSSKAA